jgi:hypothetical protein
MTLPVSFDGFVVCHGNVKQQQQTRSNLLSGWIIYRTKSASPTDASGNSEYSKPDKDDLGLPKDMQDLVDDTAVPHDTAKLHEK